MAIFQDIYFITGMKLLMGFVTMIVQIQLTGKGNLAPNTIVDQLQNFVLGGIIGGVIYNTDIGLLQFMNVLLIWTLIVVISKYLSNHYPAIRRWIDGQPVLLIHRGQVLVDNATRAGISANILADKLRAEGASDLREIDRAILERNGQLTIVKRGEAGLKMPLILDGQIDQEALKLIDHDEAWLDDHLKARGYAPEDVYMATFVEDHLVIAAYNRGVSTPID